ncbi:MAG TPA: LamG domain-containing protein [Polyangiaceae bacterium]|nr:LamG domain-containing protein [Polyangiaceae bacterium]
MGKVVNMAARRGSGALEKALRALAIAGAAWSCSVNEKQRCYDECPDSGGRAGARGPSPSVASGGKTGSSTTGTSGGAGGGASGGDTATTAGTSSSSSNAGAGGTAGAPATGASGGQRTSGGTAGAASGGLTSTLDGGGAGGEEPTGSGGSGTGGRAELLRDCRLLLHMDEAKWNELTGSVRDASGSGNHGTAKGGATTGAMGKFDRAGAFDGNGYVDLGDNERLEPGDAFTLALWVYPMGMTGDSAGLVAKRWAFGDRSAFALFLMDQNLVYVDVDGEGERFTSSQALTAESWHHVALVFDGGAPAEQRVRLYLDGQLDSTHAEASSSIPDYDSPFEVGRLRDGGGNLIGQLDEVGFWQRALTTQEITQLSSATEGL